MVEKIISLPPFPPQISDKWYSRIRDTPIVLVELKGYPEYRYESHEPGGMVAWILLSY
jgi:hypothetical protein